MLRSRLEAAASGLYGPPEALLRGSVIPETPIHGKVTEGGGNTVRSRSAWKNRLKFIWQKKASPVSLPDALLGSIPRESRNVFPVLLGWRLFPRSSVIRGETRPPLSG